MDMLAGIVPVLLVVLTALCIWLVLNQFALRREIAGNRQRLEQMTEEFKALYSGAAGQVAHIARLEEQLFQLSDKQELMDGGDAAKQSYSEMIRLVQQGAGLDDLLRHGLHREEAELLLRLHGQQPLMD